MVDGIAMRVVVSLPSVALFGVVGGMVGFGKNGGWPMRHGLHDRYQGQCQKNQRNRRPPEIRLKPGHPLLPVRPLGCIALSPQGGYLLHMTEPLRHASHPAIATRLKRAEGHLRRVIAMIEEGRPCLELATQLHAVERAVAEAKRAVIHDHIDHCVTGAPDHDLAEIKSLTRLL